MKLKLNAGEIEQLRLMDDVEDDAVERHITPDEAMVISNSARDAFDGGSADEDYKREGAEWVEDYRELREDGWPWRVAVYIAWAASPREKRWPRTQLDLAANVLGLRNDRTIRKWREKNPAIDEAVAVMQAAPLLKKRAEIFRALVRSATTDNHKNHPDRKLALEMLGDYTPKKDVNIKGTVKDLSQMSETELDDLARRDE